MSKHPSLKPKRKLKAKTCIEQQLASERKKRNRQRKSIIAPEPADDKSKAGFFIRKYEGNRVEV